MTATARNRVIGVIVALAIFIADQWLKKFVVFDLGLKQRGQSIELLPFFDFTRENNYGISLGLLQAGSMEMRWLLIAVTSAIALFVFIWMLREKARADIIALSFILGGAIGNIRDRINYGFVIDYADLHFGDFRPFLIFNLADAAISIGVVIILARTLLSRDKPEQEAQVRTES
jgi:signal peptidase II